MRYHDPAMVDYQDMIYMNLTSNNSPFTQDNEVEIFTDGKSKFTSLIKSIKEAKDHIHLLYYIVRNDELSQHLVQVLAQRAREGVQVRFLYDAIGFVGMSKKIWRPLLEAGGEVASFFPSFIPYVNIRLNYRNHRKLVVIDGHTGYIGGFNIGNEYLGLDPQLGFWRDTHLKVSGSAVQIMQANFFLDWNLSAKCPINYERRYFPTVDGQGNVGMQIVSSGPVNNLEPIRNGYLKMIYEANEFIYLQTPYFVPDDSMLTALRMAALSGIDVRIMIPGRPDHLLPYWASRSYIGDLLESGVKCYIYGDGFLHAKTIVVDGKIASVGSANTDIRSFKLNFEVNAFIFDTVTAMKLQNVFLEDIEKCSEMTIATYRCRPVTSKFVESLSRLLSPIL
ncbi:cardiolipin synthase [Desulfotomaculum defluvii]